MSRFMNRLFAFSLLAALFMPSTVCAEFEKFQAIVKFKNNSTVDTGGVHRMRALGGGYFLVSSGDVEGHRLTESEFLDALRSNDAVAHAQLDRQMTLSSSHEALQWGPSQINAPLAWYFYYAGSAATKIAVIDTGRTNHPDLLGAWSFPAYNAITNQVDYNLAGMATIDHGSWSHGTAVAGVIAARDYDEYGVTGICPRCSIIAVKAQSDDGSLSISSVISGINWAVANGASVINLSLNGYGSSEGYSSCGINQSALEAAIGSAIDANIPVVVSAGNISNYISQNSPASCSGVIVSTGLKKTGLFDSWYSYWRTPGSSGYSSLTPKLIVSAPSGAATGLDLTFATYTAVSGQYVGVCATYNTDADVLDPSDDGVLVPWIRTAPVTGVKSHCHRYMNGTSFSAAHVSGAIGLIRSVRPDLTVNEIVSILSTTASTVSNCNSGSGFHTVSCGAGKVNVWSAVNAALVHP